MSILSEKKENYHQLLRLVNEIATPALRIKFDQYFPPALLSGMLKRNESRLRAMGILNKMQMNLLYPATGVPVSDDFDITLMVCLLRNLTNIVPPVNGFDVLPPNHDVCEGADLARIKCYRNLLCHEHRGEVSTHQYNDIWADLVSAVARLNPNLQVHCDRLKVQKLNTECECHESHQVEINAWEIKDKYFAPTSAVEYICNHLQVKNCITVTGLRGIGKSVTIHHVALKLRDTQDYIIIPCRCPTEIPRHFRKDRKTLFVVDDICGKYTANIEEVKEWQRHISNELAIINSGDLKILTSNGYCVIQDPSFKKLEVLNDFVYDLSISDEEKEKIALKYLPQDTYEEIKENIGQMDYFPLMCEQYTTRPITDALYFFSNPFEIFEKEISAMRKEDKMKFCALFICVLLNGIIRKADVIVDGYNFGDLVNAHKTEIYGPHCGISRNKLQILFDICELSRGTSTESLFVQYDCLLNTYMKKTDIHYQCVHDKMFEFLCFYFGKHMQKEVILHSDSKVIRNHTHIFSLNENHDLFSISVETDNENLYFSRIMNDISQGKIYDVFCNNQMQFSSFRSKLINFLQTNHQPNLKALLMNKEEILDTRTEQVTPLYIVCYKGYLDLAIFILDKTDNYFDQNFCPLNAAASAGHCHLIELLISKGADVNYRDQSGHTPMTIACINKHKTAVKLLIDKGADLNRRTNKGPTPLMWACSSGNKPIAELLLTHGADIDKSDYGGKTPVMWARKRARHNVFDFLIYKGADLNKCDNNGWTTLMWVCFYGLTDIVDILILNNADIFQVSNEGWTSFMIACKSDKVDILKLLITKGVDINMRDNFGQTALMMACTGGHVNVVDILIENKVNIDCNDKYGVTPLIAVCSQGQLPLAIILLKGKANCNKADNEGWTPLMASCFSNNYNLTKLLVEKGANLNQSNKDCESALLVVCMGVINRKIAFFVDTEVYLKSYDNVDKRDPCNSGVTLSIIDFLLERGANIDQADKDGWSPLMWACKNSYLDIASLLIEKGADMNQVSSDGDTERSILQMALDEEKMDVVKLLFKKDINELKELIQAIKSNDMNTLEFLIDDKIRCFQENYENARMWCQVNLLNKKSLNLVNKFDDQGNAPLYISCREGSIEITELLIDRGANVNMSFCDGSTVLEAVNSQNTELVDVLIKAGAHVYPALVNAFKLKQTTKINVLLDRMPSICMNDMFDKYCEYRKDGTVYSLIENGTDIGHSIVNKRNISWLLQSIEPSTCSSALILSCQNNKLNVTRALIEFGADVNITSENNITPLMFASYYSNVVILRLLVNRRANVNAIDSNGWNALIWAFHGRNMHNVDYLIESGANIETTFICAIRNQYSWIMDALVQKGIHLDSLLDIACEYGDTSVVDLLLCNGASIHYQNDYMLTPLMTACKFGNKAVVEILVRKGSSINNALLTAVRLGENSLAKCLIETGGDLNCIFLELCNRKDRRTQNLLLSHGVNMSKVLHTACCSNDVHAVNQILTFKIDIDKCNKEGFTPLMTACWYSTEEIFQILVTVGHANIFQSLICAYKNKGFSFCKILCEKCQNEDLIKTLFEASEMGHYEIIQLLIEKKVNLNQINEKGDSPLTIACRIEYNTLVELLIENGADTVMAFKSAFRLKKESTVKLLIECGADVNNVDYRNEWSPLIWACYIRQEYITNGQSVSSDFDGIIDLLISNGADVNDALKRVCEKKFEIERDSTIEVLIHNGADINHRDENGCKLVKLLKRDGNEQCVKLLYRYGREKKTCIII